MKSIWSQTTVLPKRNSLPGNKKTDVAIIGGGMAGILTAYYLSARGKQVIVIEADRIGSGQTQNTTAKITSQHDLFYHKLLKTYGFEKAKQYADANQHAILEYKNLIEKHSIHCHLEERPSYLYSTSVSEPLRKEADSARKLGIPAVFLSKTALPFSVHGAVRFDGQAQFHPLEFLKEISASLTIYENTRAISVTEHQIFTNHGTITAKQIVFACHYPFVNLPGFYFARMYQERSYVLAVKNAQILDGMYLGIDPNGYSFRTVDDILLFGGGSHRSGKKSSKPTYETLRKAAADFWPDCEEITHWSAQDCMTLDHIPYIGQFSKSTPNWYVATGFQKWGMTTSMVSAMILSDMITGKRNPYEEIFSPQRFDLSASAKEILSHTMESTRGLTLGLIPHTPRCPHLGCQLSWNPEEASWDCPCHGSRFNHNGELLNGPAQENISFID